MSSWESGTVARRITILHVTLAHQPRDVRIFEKEARTLADAGYDVGLVVPGAEPVTEHGVRFWPLPSQAQARGIGSAPGRIRTALNTVVALRPTLVHLHEPELIPLGIALQRRGVRIVYDAHENAPVEARTLNRDRPWRGLMLSLLWRTALRFAARTFDGFVAATPEIARTLPPDRTMLVRNFPRLERLQPGPLPHAARPRRMGYVGNISRVRGLFEMLDALAAMPPTEEAELVLVGSFQPESLIREAEQHPGWARVRYMPWRPWSEISNILDSCRLGICALHPTPEMLHSLPVKLFEYLAKGLPVIASDFADWREIVGDSGYLIDPTDVGALGARMVQLLDDPTLGESMGRSGLARVRSRFSWTGESHELLALYQRLIGPPRSSEAV